MTGHGRWCFWRRRRASTGGGSGRTWTSGRRALPSRPASTGSLVDLISLLTYIQCAWSSGMICFKSGSGSYPTSHSWSILQLSEEKKKEIISEHSRVAQIPEILRKSVCNLITFSKLSLGSRLIRPKVLSLTGSGAGSKMIHIWIRSKFFE